MFVVYHQFNSCIPQSYSAAVFNNILSFGFACCLCFRIALFKHWLRNDFWFVILTCWKNDPWVVVHMLFVMCFSLCSSDLLTYTVCLLVAWFSFLATYTHTKSESFAFAATVKECIRCCFALLLQDNIPFSLLINFAPVVHMILCFDCHVCFLARSHYLKTMCLFHSGPVDWLLVVTFAVISVNKMRNKIRRYFEQWT